MGILKEKKMDAPKEKKMDVPKEKRVGASNRLKLPKLSVRQWLIVVIGGGLTAEGIALVCYHRAWLGLYLWPPMTALLSAFMKRYKGQRLKRQERAGFQYLLRRLRANIARGLSLANALIDIEETEFPVGKVKTAWLYLRRDMKLGQSPDHCLHEFGERLSDEDQRFCCEVILLTYHHGGSLQQVVQDGLQLLEERVATELAIERAIAAKQYEFRVMEGMPLILLLYVELTNPSTYADFLAGSIGAVMMTVVLLAYFIIVWSMEEKLMIEV